MAYGIILLVVLLALAPLWHFMPSRGQRRQASLREAAALAGLFVEFRDLPLPPIRLQRMHASDRQVLYYGLRLKPSQGEPRGTRSWWRSGADWESGLGAGALPTIAAELPAVVLALGVSEDSCGCYWLEDGDRETVLHIAAILRDWATNL